MNDLYEDDYGEYIYGTNLDIGDTVLNTNANANEFDHVPPCKLEGQGGYSDGSKAFKYVGTDHDPMTFHPPVKKNSY